MIITPLQIRFNDMDPMQRVNNSTYSSYLELGRLDFCNKYLSITELEDIPFVLVRIEMDLRKSLRPNTPAQVCTWVSRIGNSSWDFSARIEGRDDGQTYVEARTVQVYYNYRQDRSESIPISFRNFLEAEFPVEP
ncbi:MAG: thioesterase [Leptospiraceae bacterium]|nr:thioesterase [Leptospiraceae bacterium]